MTPVSRTVEIVEISGARRRYVAAILTRDVDKLLLNHVETLWREPRERLRARMEELGRRLEHSHWDWESKGDSDTRGKIRFLALSCSGAVQGMIAIRNRISRLRETSQLPLIYIEYVESAPWNMEEYQAPSRFGSVGTSLIEETVRVSLESGYEGRIGLHSLPETETYYRDFLGMIDFGPDPGYHRLHYFEYNAIRAQQLLSRRLP